MTETKSKQAVHDKWIRENTITVRAKFNINTEQDLVVALTGCDNKQGFIKEAVRYYIANGCPGTNCISKEAMIKARLFMEAK